VGFVLDPPVLADGVRGEVCVDRAAGQIEGGFQRKLPEAGGGLPDEGRALDLDDGGDMGLPFGFRDGERGASNTVTARVFVAVAPFRVHCPRARPGIGCGAGVLDLLTEDRLVVLELDDQMRVGDGGGLESFFWQCMASAGDDMAGQGRVPPSASARRESRWIFSSISMWARTSAVSDRERTEHLRFALASLKLSKLPFSVLPSNAMTARAGVRRSEIQVRGVLPEDLFDLGRAQPL